MSEEQIDMSGLAVQTPEGALVARITVFENRELAQEATGKPCTSIAEQLASVRLMKDYVPDLSTATGEREARASRALCVACRTGAKKVRLKAVEPLKAVEKVLLRMEQDIVQEVLATEEPIDAAIKIDEDAKEQAKIAKAQAEAIRVQKIQDLLSVFRGWPTSMIGSTSAEIQDKIARCEKSVIKEETFQEYTKDAQSAKSASIAQLHQLLASTLEQEAKTKELEAAKAEQDAKDQEIAALRRQIAEAGIASPTLKHDSGISGLGIVKQEEDGNVSVINPDDFKLTEESIDAAKAAAIFDDEQTENYNGIMAEAMAQEEAQADEETAELMSAVEDALAYHDAIVEILAAAQNTQAWPNHMKFRAFVVTKCKEILEG